ncbi:Scr1 family TA system antitoxin-like transcriptional regulator [Kitasatospora sp. NPDC094011]|uniref:helix-turn-helix domain-containing protein n=1 Tax=Kitasatospora sp. NPDC094011 TaxID=3364090 RepID=UPI0037F8C150
MNKKELDPNASAAGELGVLLRTSREHRGWSQQQVGEMVGCTSSYISALEHGRRKPSQRIATALDRAFGFEERFARGWAAPTQRALFEGFDQYVRFESKAATLRLFEINVIPSLLQTPEYVRAYQAAPVLRGVATQQQAKKRTELLFRRQQALKRDPAPFVQAVIDEGALRRPIGGHEVMRAQLRYLEDLAARPRFRIQVVPFSAAEGRPFAHPITLLTMSDRSILGYGETERRGFLERDPATLAEWTSEYDHLQGEALSRAATIAFIREVGKGFDHG